MAHRAVRRRPKVLTIPSPDPLILSQLLLACLELYLLGVGHGVERRQ